MKNSLKRKWKTESGERKVENRYRKTNDGKWRTEKQLLYSVIRLLVFSMAFYLIAPTLQAQMYPGEEAEETAKPYHESALRRFEIISLVSLPFTTIHSYLAVRGVRMAMQRKVAPKLSDTDYKIIGVSAVTFSAFIGFWDWLHTRGKDTSQLLIPKEPKKPTEKPPQSSYDETSSEEFIPEDGMLHVQLFQVKF